jgi:subtilisin
MRRSEAIPWGVHYTNADRVQSAFSNTGSGVKVGVMDTGIDCANSDFGTIHGVNYPSDGFGYCDDPFEHGTGAAGVIGAVANGSEVVGMAPGVKLYSIRVFDDGDNTTDAWFENGLQFAIDSGIQVLNLSWGDCGPRSRTLPTVVVDDIADAITAGIVVTAAAGNGSHSAHPACLSTDSISNYAAQPNVIAVSAVDTAIFSPSGFQYGSKIWVAAPTNVESDSATTTLASYTGTSAATPHVAGAAALLIYQGKTAGEVRTTLSYETQNKPDTTLLAHNNHLGYGVLDVAAAVQPTPQIWSFGITSACNPHTTHGVTCTLTPTLGISGYSPVTYTWTHTEDSPGTISVSESGSVFTFVAGGDTSVTFTVHVKAWPHDTVTARHPRTGLESDYNVLVCHGGSGDLMVASGGVGGPRQIRAQSPSARLSAPFRLPALPPALAPAGQLPSASMPPPPLACG